MVGVVYLVNDKLKKESIMDDPIFTATDSSLVLVLRNGKEIRFEPPCDNCDEEDDCYYRYEIWDHGDKYDIDGVCVIRGGYCGPQQSGTFKKKIVSGYYDE